MAFGTLAVIVSVYDFDRWKAPPAAQIKAATGYDLAITGDIGLKASIVPTFVVKDISIANVAWASQEKFVEIARFEVRPSIISVLFGSLIAEEVLFDGVRVNLETDGDGGANWRQQRHRAVPDNALDFEMGSAALRKLSVFDIKLRFRSAGRGASVYHIRSVWISDR